MSLGIGLLGLAHGHIGTYCTQWRQWPDEIRLVAGWDDDADRVSAEAQKFGYAVAGTAAELLARRDVQAVVIGAETSRHADLVEQAAGAGKAIVLQKPLALTLAEADRIVAAVRGADVPFTLAWQMRVDPQNLYMRQFMRDGRLGRVYMLRRRHGLSTHVWPGFADSWHVRRELNRGMWADDAAHAIDFVYWMLGGPVSVTAEVHTLRDPKVPDDHGIAVFRYADGALAEVACSFVCLGGENTTEIVGEEGVMIQNYGDAVSCGVARAAGSAGLKWLRRGDGAWTDSGLDTPSQHGSRIAALARPLLEFLQRRRPPLATAAEGRDVLRMTLGCYQSSACGRRIDMTEVRDC